MKKIAIFDQCLASSHVANSATVRCYKWSATRVWQVGDTYRWSLYTALEWGVHYRITMAICCRTVLCDRDI